MEDNRRGGKGRSTEGRREYGRRDSKPFSGEKRPRITTRRSFSDNGERTDASG